MGERREPPPSQGRSDGLVQTGPTGGLIRFQGTFPADTFGDDPFNPMSGRVRIDLPDRAVAAGPPLFACYTPAPPDDPPPEWRPSTGFCWLHEGTLDMYGDMGEAYYIIVVW